MIHVILQKDISKNVCYKRIKHAKNVDGSMCKINNNICRYVHEYNMLSSMYMKFVGKVWRLSVLSEGDVHFIFVYFPFNFN